MRAGGAKQKGSSFENLVGKQFREWWQVDKPLFTRLPRHTGNQGEYWYPKEFPWLLELKHYKDIDFWQLFSAGKFVVKEWWAKASEEAFNMNKKPMLIIKKNNYPALCGIGWDSSRDLESIYKRDDFLPMIYLKFNLEDKSRIKFFLLEKLFTLDVAQIKQFQLEKLIPKSIPPSEVVK